MTLKEVYDNFIEDIANVGYTKEEVVLGFGNEKSEIMLLGEAPGKDEVIKKRPFVGKAGKNLDEFLEYTGIKRESLFITNTVKMRPYKVSEKGTKSNRPPNAKEKELCRKCLLGEIEALRPKLTVTLGNTALKALLGKDKTIGELHGKAAESEYGKVFALYHPASIIYRRELKEVYLEDLLKLKEYIIKCL